MSAEQDTAKSSAIQLSRDADVLIRSFLPFPTPEINYRIDDLPTICIPQISVSVAWDSAFVRGYNPELINIGLSQDMFLNFIDGLNLALAASPPLRVVNMAGVIIGMVPYHWAMVAGTLMQVSAQVGMHVLSKTLTDRYLRAANHNMFKPRGLSVRLCTTKAMFALVTGSPDGKVESKTKKNFNKFGRGVGSVVMKLPIPVIGPIAQAVVHAVADKPPPISATGVEGDPIKSPVVMRRLAMTNGISLPMQVDNLPPPAKPEGAMDTISSWGVRFDGMLEKNSEKSAERRRRALQRIHEAQMSGNGGEINRGIGVGNHGFGFGSSNSLNLASSSRSTELAQTRPSGSSSNGVKKLASQVWKAQKDLRWQRELQTEEREQSMRAMRGGGLLGVVGVTPPTRMEAAIKNADLLEHWNSEKVLWIVIMKADKDSEIENVEIADDPADEEYIEAEVWNAEMAREMADLEREERLRSD